MPSRTLRKEWERKKAAQVEPEVVAEPEVVVEPEVEAEPEVVEVDEDE